MTAWASRCSAHPTNSNWASAPNRWKIFFCQHGELRDRTFDNQVYRASGLNLVVAAAILWNTRYLELAAADLGVEPEIMRHVAPLGWEHLSLTGDYAWDTADAPAPGELRLLKTRPSLLAA